MASVCAEEGREKELALNQASQGAYSRPTSQFAENPPLFSL